MAVARTGRVCHGTSVLQVTWVFPYALRAQGMAEFLPQYQVSQAEPWCALGENYFKQ